MKISRVNTVSVVIFLMFSVLWSESECSESECVVNNKNSPHLTKCYFVSNQMNSTIQIRNLEDQRVFEIKAGKKIDFNGALFPWCMENYEPQRKAFHVQLKDEKGDGYIHLYYIYQYYPNKTIYYSKNGSLDNQTRCADGVYDSLDIIIKSNRIPACVNHTLVKAK